MPETDVVGSSERRKPDRVGNIPQWFTSILLACIGVMILMIWNSLEHRVAETERKLDSIMSNDATHNTKIVTLEGTLNKLEQNQQNMNALLQALNIKLEVISTQVQKIKQN